MKFTVAIIGRNEQDVILRCVKLVSDADEIVYMDTGSTDNTLKELKKYKGKNLVIAPQYQWRDDFSHARNVCTSYAKNDWILTIDCDEEVEEGTVKTIERELDNQADLPGFNGFKVSVVLPNETSPQLRVHRKSNHWFRPAHNRLTVIHGFTPLNVSIKANTGSSHTYDPEMRKRIITRYLGTNPTDAEMWYYLGREYMKVGDIQGAIDKFSNMQRFTYLMYTDLYIDGLFLLAQCYYVLEKLDEARIVLGEIVSLNPDYYEAVELLARINFHWTRKLQSCNEDSVLIKRRPINLMDERRIVKRVAQLASLPEREGNLKKVLASVVPYVDEVYVMLNNYSRVPSWMKDMKRVIPVLRKNQKGDAEKFLDVEKRKDSMIYILDDDLIYNETFFNVCHDSAIRYRVPVGFHGKKMGKDVSSYSHGAVASFPCLQDVSASHYVDVVGTGCLCFTLDDCNISYRDFESANVGDLWFSHFCKKNNIAMLVLAHSALGYLAPPEGTTIWDTDTKTAKVTALYKKLFEQTNK